MPPTYRSRYPLQSGARGLEHLSHDTSTQSYDDLAENRWPPLAFGVQPLAPSNFDMMEALKSARRDDSETSDDWSQERASPPWRHMLATNLKPGVDKPSKGPPMEVPPITDDCANRRKPCEGVGPIRQETISGVPFIRGRANKEWDQTAAFHDDVKQGKNNSCYLLAALISMTRQAPGVLEDRIDYNESTGKFRVWLYLPDKSGVLSLQPVEVDNGFHVDGQGNPVYAKPGDTGRDGEELWPMLIEKAYAQMKEGYQGIDWGSKNRNMEVLTMLTGNEAYRYKIEGQSPDEVRKTILRCLNPEEKQVITTVSKAKANDGETANAKISIQFPGGRSRQVDLHEKHRYTIIAIDDDSVTLEFPTKGEPNIGKISLADYMKHFDDIVYASAVPPKSDRSSGEQQSRSHSR